MGKIAIIILALLFVSASGSYAAPNYQDWWWSPLHDGMGVNIGQQGDTVVGAWYHYDSDGTPAFLLFSGRISNGMVHADLWRSTGPPPGPGFDPALVSRAKVGAVALHFLSENSAALTFSFDGRTGVLNLVRFTFAQIAVSGFWEVAAKVDVRNCANPASNGSFSIGGYMSVNRGADTLTLTSWPDWGGTCSIGASFNQAGSTASGTGTFACNNGASGSLSFRNLRVIGEFMTIEYIASYSTPAGCVETGRIGAVR